MSNHDLKDIDDFINLPRDSGLIYAMDFEAIDKLKTLLEESDKPCFVVLVKMGIHFPYYLRYPADGAMFKPDYDKSSAMVEVVQYKGTSEGAQRQLNTYLNSIAYCVDYYLEYLSQKFDLDKTMVIYTSDHGQSINSKKTPASHNTWPAVVPEQFSVPLILLGSDFKKLFTEPKQDQYSAFQIFPSLLTLMGYPDEVVSKYGPTLFKEGISQQSWLGPLFGPDGRLKPVNTGEADISLPGEQFAKSWESR